MTLVQFTPDVTMCCAAYLSKSGRRRIAWEAETFLVQLGLFPNHGEYESDTISASLFSLIAMTKGRVCISRIMN